MLKNKKFLVAYKLFFALLGFSALITEIAVTVERGVFLAPNFFSFFTVQVNILVFVTFLLSAIIVAGGKPRRWLDILRSFSTVNILIVGVGFAILLSGLEGVALTAVPWDNTVLHYIIPIAVLLDFIIDRPKRKISFKTGLTWAIYPVAYVVYSLVRGEMVGWYPYPFLNPTLHGLTPVLVAVGGLTLLGIALIALVTRFTRLRKQ